MAEYSGQGADRNALDEGWGDVFGASTVPIKPASSPAGAAPLAAVVPIVPKPLTPANELSPAVVPSKPPGVPTALPDRAGEINSPPSSEESPGVPIEVPAPADAPAAMPGPIQVVSSPTPSPAPRRPLPSEVTTLPGQVTPAVPAVSVRPQEPTGGSSALLVASALSALSAALSSASRRRLEPKVLVRMMSEPTSRKL